MAASLSENWLQLAAAKAQSLRVRCTQTLDKTPDIILQVFPWQPVKVLRYAHLGAEGKAGAAHRSACGEVEAVLAQGGAAELEDAG